MTTSDELFIDDDVVKKAYLETKIFSIEGQISFIEKDYNEFNLQCNDTKYLI